MTTEKMERAPIEEPLAEIERQLINAYITGAGYERRDLNNRNDPEAKKVLADASCYASEKLSEIEARAHFVRELHGHA